MTRRKIEKEIFSILKLMPLIFVLVYFALNFANLWRNNGNVDISIITNSFNQILANFSVLTEMSDPVKYLLNDIFGINEVLATSISYYFIWLIVIELLWLMFDLFVYIPRILRSLVEGGLNEK